MTELELERDARRLERRTLTRVLYQRARAIDAIRAGAAEHAIEHRVVLEFGDSRIAIDYDGALATRHGFGIALRQINVVDPAYGAIEDVSATPRWRGMIDHEVATSRIVWDDVRARLRGTFAISVAIHADYLTRRDFPSALELEVGGTQVLIAAARRAPDGELVGYVNELLVSFS